MQCEEARQLFTDYVDGALPERDREAFSAHLEQCAKCAQELRAFDHAVVAVRSLPQASPPGHLRERIREALYAAAAQAPSVAEARAAKRSRLRVWLGASIGAAAAVGLLMVVVLVPYGRSTRLALSAKKTAMPAAEARGPEAGRLGGGAMYEGNKVVPEAANKPAAEAKAPVGLIPREVTPPAAPAHRLYASRVLPPSGRVAEGLGALEAATPGGEVVASLVVAPRAAAGQGDRVGLRARVLANDSIADAAVSLNIRQGEQDTRTVPLYRGPLGKGETRDFAYDVETTGASFAAQAAVKRDANGQVLAQSEEVRVPAQTRVATAAGGKGAAGSGGELGERGPAGPAEVGKPTALVMGAAAPTVERPTPPGAGAPEVVAAPGAAAARGAYRGGAGFGGAAPESTLPAVREVFHNGFTGPQKLLDVSFRNESLHQALREVGKQAGVQVTIDAKVPNPKVNYQAQKTAVPLVFEALARKGNAAAVLKDGAWHIVPKPPVAVEPAKP